MFGLALIAGVIIVLRLLRRKNRSGNVGNWPMDEPTSQYKTVNDADASQERGGEIRSELNGRPEAEIDSGMRWEAHG